VSRPALPVAGPLMVRRAVSELLRRHRRRAGVVLLIQAVAVGAGLVGPRILGRLVDGVGSGLSRDDVDRLALVFAVALVAQALLTRWARLRAARLGEEVLAELREDFVARSLALPLDTVERAGTGDLVTRATSDIDKLQYAVRQAGPEIAISLLTCVLIVAAAFLTAPLVACGMLLGGPLLFFSTRWYRRRAPEGYRAEMAAWSRVSAGVVESAEAGRSVESLALQPSRLAAGQADVAEWLRRERYTTYLRMVWWPAAEVGYVLLLVGSLLVGGLLVADGRADLAGVTAVALYMQMLVEPLDQILSWLDELQIGMASLARLVGVRDVEPVEPTAERPGTDEVVADDVRYAYREGRDVLHGVDLAVPSGTRLAVVGPSGAGKSTLGRLLAGIHPPRTGSVTVGGAEVYRLAPDVLREQVALVTQEHHVFVGTVRENVALARPGATEEEVRAALAAVDALAWVDALPAGLATVVGSGGHRLAPAQAQQVALARIVLADPHTLVLDEATALLDPRAARHLERSLAAVLRGRTVVAIAHRLHTAHDADLVAVVDEGQVQELGTHDELLAAGGAYAALWESWRA
jgi:ABC-type multidrug transport system fused ATPase/permease subunit